MNRRELLAWLGLAACGPRRGPAGGGSRGSGARGSAAPRDASTEAEEHLAPIADDFSNSHTTQLNTNPLIVRGELLSRVTQDELQFVDATSLKVTDRVTEQYRSACVWKGTVFGFTQPGKGPCEIDMFERTQLLRSMPVAGCTGSDGVNIVVSGGSSLYIENEYGHMTRYRLKNNALEDETVIEGVDNARIDLSQAIGLDDGRVLVPANIGARAYGGPSPASFAVAHGPAHLCAGSNGRIWYSMYKDHVLDQVVLARLGSSLETEATLAVTPGRVTHMASGADGSLAIMTVAPGGRSWIWTIILLDAKGSERKRIVIDDDLTKQVDTDLNAAFVALTPTTIVIDAGRHGLFGWNASTGARI